MKKYVAMILFLLGAVSAHADLQNSEACKVANQISNFLGSPLEDALNLLVKIAPQNVDVHIFVPGQKSWTEMPIQENRLDIDIMIIDHKTIIVGTNCG